VASAMKKSLKPPEKDCSDALVMSHFGKFNLFKITGLVGKRAP